MLSTAGGGEFLAHDVYATHMHTAAYAMSVCLSVCLTVCLSHWYTKWHNESSRFSSKHRVFKYTNIDLCCEITDESDYIKCAMPQFIICEPRRAAVQIHTNKEFSPNSPSQQMQPVCTVWHPPNQQCQCSARNSKHWPQSGQITHRPHPSVKHWLIDWLSRV